MRRWARTQRPCASGPPSPLPPTPGDTSPPEAAAPAPCRGPSGRYDAKCDGSWRCLPLTSPFLERIALHHLEHQARELVAVPADALDDVVEGATVVILYPTSQGIRQQFLGHAAGKLVLALEQVVFQVFRPLEGLPGRQRAGRVDGELAVHVPPGADAVVVLEDKAERVEPGVARGAVGVLAMGLHALAQRRRLDDLLVLA